MNRALGVLAACALAAAMGSARAEIFRCTAAGGAVTYQEIPCAASEKGSVLEVPASYPAVDRASRERLFAREAALDQRLEAQRERDSRESVARLLQPAPPVTDSEADAPLYPIAAYRPYLHRAAPRHPFGNRQPNHG